MNWTDERYVRLYTRDSADWLLWPWQARALMPLLLRKLDRAGTVDLGRHGLDGLAILVGMPADVVRPGLEALLADGCLVGRGTTLCARNYLAAQEAVASGAERSKRFRELRRDQAVEAQTVTPRNARNATQRDATDRNATQRAQRNVTPSLAVPCLAVPNQIKEASLPCADAPAAESSKPRKLSAAQAFVVELDAARQKTHPELMPSALAEPSAKVARRVNAQAGPTTALGQAIATRHAALIQAFERYLEDDYWRTRGWPVEAFLADSVWRKHLDAVAAAGPPEKPCRKLTEYELAHLYDDKHDLAAAAAQKSVTP